MAFFVPGQLDDKQRLYATHLSESAQTLNGIIEEVLDYSHIESGSLKLAHRPFSLRATIRQAVAGVEGLAGGKALALQHECADDCPDELMGDGKRLGQVLAILLGNAVKFTEKGGVRVLARQPEPGLLELLVEDSGIGIEPDKLSLIFDPFRQGDGSQARKYGGTGLGLTITRRLVEAMGGTISVASTPGVGSVFRVLLPMTVAERSGLQSA